MSDNTTHATVLILRDIQARLGRLEQRVDAGFARCDQRFTEIDARFERLDARFDNFSTLFGGAYRDHERRVTAVEVRIDRLDPPPSPRRRR